MIDLSAWTRFKKWDDNDHIAYIDHNHKKILKIAKNIDDSQFNTPQRAMRLWNLINPEYPAEPYYDEDGNIIGWARPFILGEPATEDHICSELIHIFNCTGRVFIDVQMKNNFLDTPDGKTICMGSGMALELENREDEELVRLKRTKSSVSLDAWEKGAAAFWLKIPLRLKSKPVTMVKALLFIKMMRPDISNVDFLKGNPQVIQQLAAAFENLMKKDIYSHLKHYEVIPQDNSFKKQSEKKIAELQKEIQELQKDLKPRLHIASHIERQLFGMFCTQQKNKIKTLELQIAEQEALVVSQVKQDSERLILQLEEALKTPLQFLETQQPNIEGLKEICRNDLDKTKEECKQVLLKLEQRIQISDELKVQSKLFTALLTELMSNIEQADSLIAIESLLISFEKVLLEVPSNPCRTELSLKNIIMADILRCKLSVESALNEDKDDSKSSFKPY